MYHLEAENLIRQESNPSHSVYIQFTIGDREWANVQLFPLC